MSIIPENLVLPGRVLARGGAVQALAVEAADFGSRGLLVHGRSLRLSGCLDRITAAVPAGTAVVSWEHPGGEPTLGVLRHLLEFARKQDIRWVAGVGGGSVIDLAKACAGLLQATGDPESYHEGAAIRPSKIPFVAIPTTAGTGSECTVVCVLTNERTNIKKSFRHPSFMARLVILDSELVESCPPAVIAASGMDAMTQAIEAFASRGSTWFTDELAMKGLMLISENIERVFAGEKGEVAANLLLGSFFAGIALSNARLGIVHGLAHPLGARFHVAHGLACAVCLPHALAFNREAMGAKWNALNQVMGKDVIARVTEYLGTFQMESPFSGKTLDDRKAVIEETLASGSTAANPRPVGAADVEWFLDHLLKGAQ